MSTLCENLTNYSFLTCRNQLIRKQNDLRLFLSTLAVSKSHDELLQDDLIEFDEEIEIFDENNELLSNGESFETENFMNEDDITEELIQGDDKLKSTVVCREKLKFEKSKPQLILTPKFLFAREIIKNPEQISSELESPLIDINDKVNFKCLECNISFLTDGELKLHIKDHNLISKTDFHCTPCSISLKNKHAYENHMSENHNQKFICQTCGNIYNSRRNLRSHLRSHNLIKKYKCTNDGCDKSFRHHHHLTNHLRVHTKNSPFVCNECDQTFRQKYALTLHKKKHEKNFIECEKCRSQFIRPIQLTKHRDLCDGTFRPYVVRTKKRNNKNS